ncbi:MAG: phospholipid carrier-dependent glycosyltransferase [Bacteroidia bacterium]
MKNYKLLFVFSIFVVVAYFIFGIFFLNIPPVKADELWEISRAHFLLKYHHQGDPLLPKELSPYMTSLFNATSGSKYQGIVKTASQAFFIAWVPIDDIYAFRLTAFAWSLLVCFLTYQVAIKTGLNKAMALFAAILLIITPEFFSHLHSQRPEIMITAAYLAGLLFFIYIIEMENSWKKTILLFFSGIYTGLTTITLHPNAIVIPATFGCLYLLREYKNIFSLNTLFFGISMLAGIFYLYYLQHAPAVISVAAGGGNLLQGSGPPILRRGIKVIISLPLIFYKKFTPSSVFARPFSLLFFLASCISFYYLFKKKKNSPVYKYIDILFIAIVVPLIVLPLLSSSNGFYNIFVLPLCAVLIAAAIYELSLTISEKSKLVHILTAILCIIFLSDFSGIQKQNENSKEFQRIRKELKSVVTNRNSTIMGSGLYYLDFKDQHYYSASGLNPRIGRPSQSFEEAVYAVRANYLIIDRAFIHNMYRERGKNWTDSMFFFINNKCDLVSAINDNKWAHISKEPNYFPAQLSDEIKKNTFLNKINVYRVINS